MTTTAIAWGFSSLIDEDWALSACKGSDPDMFEVTGKFLTPENTYALAMCDTCPIRTKCRDDYLKRADRIPLGIIAGGWWWDSDGRCRPHPADRNMKGPGRSVRVRTAGQHNGRTYAARRAIVAARAVLADPAVTRAAVAAEHRLTLGHLDNAIAIVRWAPDLLDEVCDGTRTLTSAHQVATARLQAAHRDREMREEVSAR